jgi:hypothetical protein
MDRFNLKKLIGAELKEQYEVISNRFAALENLDDNVDSNRARKIITGNIKISGKESPRLLCGKTA